MSFAEKQLLQENILKGMASELTGTQLMALKSCISEQLDTFIVEQSKAQYSDVDDYLGVFIAAKRVEGRSAKTIERYEYIIRKMQESLCVPTKQISVYHLRSYLTELKDSGMSDRSL